MRQVANDSTVSLGSKVTWLETEAARAMDDALFGGLFALRFPFVVAGIDMMPIGA